MGELNFSHLDPMGNARMVDMIPLCHSLLIGAVTINFEIAEDHIAIEA